MRLSRKDLEALSRKTGQVIPESDLRQAKGESKYKNQIVELDGYTFQSLWERDYYAGNLKLRLLAGEISDLRVHKTYSLDCNGVHICKYIGDFTFVEQGKVVVHDTKGASSGNPYQMFKIKKALMLALLNIDVVEVRR